MCCCHLPSSNASWSGSGCATRSLPPSAKAFGSAARSHSATRPWTRRSLWYQPRLRRFARSLRGIWSLAPFARWRRISIAGEFAASRGGRRTAGPSAGAASAWGALAHLLKNRFYIGEVVYRGEVHGGEQAPIVDRALFAAVQAKLAAQAVARRCRLRGAPLSGHLFDNRGNRMSPTHANKGGARYHYYVSQAVLQNKPPPSGLVGRVPAAEIEALVVVALRSHLSASSAGEQLPDNDRDLLERHLERVTLTPNHLELRLRQIIDPAQARDPANTSAGRPIASITTVPWTSPIPAAVKGIIHVPAHNTPIKASRREALLIAIAKARQWIDDLAHGRAASFAVIARQEGKAERHIRLLAPLAFVSPRIVSALLDGTAPADLTLTKLARGLPYCWAEQEQRAGSSAPFHG